METIEIQKIIGELLSYISQTNGVIDLFNLENLRMVDYLGETSTTELINKLTSEGPSPSAPWWDDS